MALEHYNFSSDFQDMLLAALVRHPEKFMGVRSVLDSRYFTGLNSITAAKLILDYATERNTFPSFTALGQMAYDHTKKAKSEDFNHDLTEYVKMLSEVIVRDLDYLKSQIVNFAKERALLIEITQAALNIQEGKDQGDLVQRFQKVMSIGIDLNSLGTDANADAEAVLDRILNPDYGIPTGYDILDTHLFRRGMGKGWLIVPLAPPKGYKTTFCLNIAAQVAGPTIGEDVVYYACEINEELALERVYCHLSQQTQQMGEYDPIRFSENVYASLDARMKGRLIVKHFPAKTVKVSQIRAHLREMCLAKNIKPRVVVLDYAETLVPENPDDPEYRQQSSIYTSARALADEFECTVIMPDRCNKETTEQAVPTITSFQGAFEKGGIVDAGIGICSTPDEYARNVIRFYVFLYRYGASGLHFKGRVDPEKYTITIDELLNIHDLQRLHNEMAEVRQQRHGHRAPRRGAGNREAAEDERVGG